ncbi:hypothetical protein EDB92DRAFT_1814381 [Lactarius akahatsu]|uniref:FAD-binding PCMH-type domain-containing protein n=1 Tax=Lactarius akahatsu TaxID=416441 RepID=A0AAD4LMB9_9AGAM|nr:hypothetical protein EDB92DRAFT_1814381 [Lactarius akahatsu]
MGDQELREALRQIQSICDESNGRTQLFRSGSHGHLNGIRHYYESSSQDARFSVEPGSAEDLSKIMQVIKAYPVPFAVKGGGHTSNPGFSSTPGIQISLLRFNKISFNDNKTELTVGAGCAFDEIYKVIRPENYNIVGGGGSVGIGGWMMGGGYSLKTNQYGLGIDNLVRSQIVLPDGRRVTASADAESDIFWAIKGGGNNFGIATEFVLKTHRQGTNGNGYVYGGLLTFDKARVERVKKAIVNFMKMNDPKAAIEAVFRFYRNHGVQEVLFPTPFGIFKFTVLAFYDDKKPEGYEPFSDFLAIPHQGRLTNSRYTELDAAKTLLYSHIPADVATSILSTHEDNDFAPMHFPSPDIPGIGVISARARWGSVMVSKYTPNLINVVEEEAKAAKRLMQQFKGRMVMAEIWPFLPTMFDRSVDSAWPHRRGEPNGPLVVYFMWEGTENDEVWINQMMTALDHIHRIALEEKCTTPSAPVYCNTTLEDVTTPEQIYRDNLDRLSALRISYDPDNVMGRTGGFRIPFPSSPATVDEH